MLLSSNAATARGAEPPAPRPAGLLWARCSASITLAARVASFRNVTHRPQKDRTAFPARDRPVSGHPTGPGAVARQHRRECVGPPPRELSSPRRRAPRWRSRRPPRPVRNRMSPSPSGTGHRTPVTEPPTSLPPVCDRGRGRASRRRGDAAPASAFRRRPLNGGQVGRLDPSGAAMHKLLVLANALVGQNRPGEDRTTGARRRGSGREVRRVHAGARHAGGLVDHHGLYGTGCRRRRRAPDTGH